MNLLSTNKLYRVLAASRLLNSLGAYLYNVVFVMYAATQFQSTWAVSVANMMMVLPTLFTFFVGIRADKTRQKAKWLIGATFVQALLFLIMSLVLHKATLAVFAFICLGNVLSDLLSDYTSGLRLPILQKNLAEEEMMEAYSLFQLITCLCGIAGQALGVWLLTLTNNHFGLVAAVNALFFAFSGFVLYAARGELTYDEVVSSSKPIREEFSAVFKSMKDVFQSEHTGNFLAVLTAILVMNALGGSIGAIYTLYFLKTTLWGLSYAQSLLAVHVILVVSMIIGSLTPNDRVARLPISHMMLLNAVTLSGIGLANLLGAPVWVGLLLLSFASYLGGKVNPKIDALLLAHTSPELLARTNHLLTMLFTLSLPVGTVLFSFLAGIHMGLTWAVFTLIALTTIILVRVADGKKVELKEVAG